MTFYFYIWNLLVSGGKNLEHSVYTCVLHVPKYIHTDTQTEANDDITKLSVYVNVIGARPAEQSTQIHGAICSTGIIEPIGRGPYVKCKFPIEQISLVQVSGVRDNAITRFTTRLLPPCVFASRSIDAAARCK